MLRFFFFKQKTAYEMRISDWSSDVCSSDLGANVMLAGHADKSGAASYNVGLSQRRADAVRAYMTSKGIPDGVISTEAFGERAPRVETADGVRELQRSEEHTSELQSLMRISYAVFCLKKKQITHHTTLHYYIYHISLS